MSVCQLACPSLPSEFLSFATMLVFEKGIAMNSDQFKGKLKEAVGDVTGDENLQEEGKEDQLAGDAKEVVQNVADKAEDAIDDIKRAVQGE